MSAVVPPASEVPHAMAGADLVDQLRSALDRAGELARVLEANLRASQRGPGW